MLVKCKLFHNEYDIIAWKGMFSDKNRSMAGLKASGINGIVENGHHILWLREKYNKAFCSQPKKKAVIKYMEIWIQIIQTQSLYRVR